MFFSQTIRFGQRESYYLHQLYVVSYLWEMRFVLSALYMTSQIFMSFENNHIIFFNQTTIPLLDLWFHWGKRYEFRKVDLLVIESSIINDKIQQQEKNAYDKSIYRRMLLLTIRYSRGYSKKFSVDDEWWRRSKLEIYRTVWTLDWEFQRSRSSW